MQHSVIPVIDSVKLDYSALLGLKVVPSSHPTMSTAVPIEFSYNTSDDEDQRFHAEIVMVTSAEFYNQLQTMQALADTEISDMDMARFEEMSDRAGLIFPFIDWLDVHMYDMRAVANHESVRDQLDQTLHIKEKDLRAFVKKLGDMVMGLLKLNAFLPLLVAKARVYLKSDILEAGITLVDLPGRPGATYYKPVEDTLKSLNTVCVRADSMNRQHNRPS